ncbi:MAG TPA: hypothetical protein VL325_04015 [Pyrinomonadaceae bacterium]|nr:hypothetical protein [Pyrinomonadaceae bacterium]
MINKTKYFLLLILCAGMVGGLTSVMAQTRDNILVSKNGASLRQSDIDQMIEFYEWAFEARFSTEQKSKFAEYTVREFRTDPTKYRATVDDIVATFEKISSADESTQQKTRNNFLPAFVAEMRKSTDENSQMLLSIYEAARGKNISDVTSNTESDKPEAGIGNISDVAGTWAWARSGSSTYSTGGAYMGSNGSRFTYKFLANGLVEYTGIMNVMTGGCKMQIFKSAKGKASLNGTTLTINWSPASFSRDDSCDRAGNYKKTIPAETETFQVKFKTDYGQRQLCMTGKDEMCYSPSN